MYSIQHKRFLLVGVSILTLVGAIWLSYWITEHLFFDKFYYQKSLSHGYHINNVPFIHYGKRAEDLVMLQNFFLSPQCTNSIDMSPQTRDDGIYTIVVIGDSVVWGQGIRNGERFSELLEKKLNKTRATKVVSLGRKGNDFFDYYLSYLYIQFAIPHIDLFVFAFNDNDIFFKPRSNNELLKAKLSKNCDKPIVYNDFSEDPLTYMRLNNKSYSDDSGNTCLFRKIIPLLPKENAIYFDTMYKKYDNYRNKILQPLIDNRLHVVTPDYTAMMTEWAYVVSESERHPSAFANKVFADVLYEKITRLQTQIK